MAAKPTSETEKGTDMVCRARGRVSLTSSRMRVGICTVSKGCAYA